MELWNCRNIVPPALLNGKNKSKHIKKELKQLVLVANASLDYFKKLDSFELAAAYVCRFSAQWIERNRGMHSFRLLKQVRQALLRIKNVDICRDLGNFYNFLPDLNYIEQEVSLPLRTNMDYILVRFQGMAKLLCRIVMLCKKSVHYYLQEIAIRFQFHINSMFVAALSEVWAKAREMCRKVVQFYDEFIAVQWALPEGTSTWLPKGYELQSSLAIWLGNEYVEEIAKDFEAIELDTVADVGLYSLIEEQAPQEVKQKEPPRAKKAKELGEDVPFIPKVVMPENDIGDTVNRADVVQRKKSVKKHSGKSNKWPFLTFKSKFQVKQFLMEEKTKRQSDLRNAISHAISSKTFDIFMSTLSSQYNNWTTLEFVQFFKDEFEQMLLATTGDNKNKKKKPPKKRR